MLVRACRLLKQPVSPSFYCRAIINAVPGIWSRFFVSGPKNKDEFTREKIRLANEQLKKHPDFASVMVQIGDAIRIGNYAQRLERLPIESSVRMELVIEILDLRAGSFVNLVSSLDDHGAFRVILWEIARSVWFDFAHFNVEAANKATSGRQSRWREITQRCEYWQIEGFRRLVPQVQATEKPIAKRQGYRDHIRSWMKLKNIKTVELAAKHLGVSSSTLKSIMSSVGQVRYSPETLATVLSKTQYKQVGE